MSLRFHLFASDVDPRNEDFVCKRAGVEIFLCSLRDRKVLLNKTHPLLKKDVP